MKSLNSDEIEKELSPLQARIFDVKNEIKWLENSPTSKKDAQKRFCNLVDQNALAFTDKLRPDNIDIFNVNGKVTRSLDIVTGSTVNMGPLLCGLFAEQIKSAFKEKLDALDYEQGPPQHDRPALLKELHAELLKLETREEELVSMANNIGLAINRRNDFNPAVVLGFKD